jgi:transposase
MPAPVALRDDFDAVTLRGLARCSQDSRQSRRLLALAAVYDGMSRAAAAQIGGMDRQSLRDWAHRFNEHGPDGLFTTAPPGRACWLNAAQMAELDEIVATGPDPECDGVVRWRRCDLVQLIEERFDVVYAERSISRLLAKLGYVRISARPRHPAQDAEEIEAFKKTSLRN